MSFKFEIFDKVGLANSTEEGVVIGRAEYAEGTRSYLLRYRDAAGCAKEAWWKEAALCAVKVIGRTV
jgi:hypothetical protein